MWSEATSAIHELAFRGEIDTETGLSAIGRLRHLGVVRSDHPDLHLEAAHLARRLGGFKTYDAEYVALAQLTGSRLLTRDARLQRGAGRLIRVVGPEDLGSASVEVE
jgi:predicted nucleic acid-binding protein